MKVLGYLRVSTDGQVRDGISVKAQEKKIRAWAELNEAETVTIFNDAGLSGKRADNRPGLRDALRTIGRGDALVVYSLSRLARSTKDTISIAETLDRRGADLVSLSEKIDTTTASGKMLFRMLAVLSEFERDQISERTRMALSHKRSNGQKTGGDVPFGHHLKDGSLVPDENEQAAISLILQLRHEGTSLRAIAAELETRGHLTKRGHKRWNPKTVSSIIAREQIAA
jgi:site-specific DNA recombinase